MSTQPSPDRVVVLDTETTGMPVTEGHRIIEIGCIELIGRRLSGQQFHCYLQPDREVDEGAQKVHGLTDEFLRDKPKFVEIADEFFAFIEGAQLVIHNAPFDLGFLHHEFALINQHERAELANHCTVIDTLALARERHPGQRNNLDALCKRYGIDNSGRELHGALLDASLLADVYLAMSGGQASLLQSAGSGLTGGLKTGSAIRRLPENRRRTPVLAATAEELAEHEAYLLLLEKASGKKPELWN
ncbi:DNA polymerase III subunit epsilon [Ventosimonas gracilis]|uniref:DNA polymerase III subunit epsilon n=1 Tax=Ventosimonas gracilis TaxID=1680762 RepID=A0A139SR83_9GAMM|nr:DNA polymerase III subunit epsilon [Ventosimonas gracilis]KXU36961.1 DNA polymerase III subunit epsilon [Ventosimonas gracilis]